MVLKVLLLVAWTTAVIAAPAAEAEDLAVAEGRHVPTYDAPVAYGPAPAPKHGSGIVSSYNRRGSYAQASEYAKPSIYGSSYGAQSSIGAPSYAPRASHYDAPLQRYGGDIPAYAPRQEYGGYGPQRNEYSAHSQRLSQDPHYDPAKDPVSQYAEYVPVREYAPKSQSDGSELSIYGYKK
ncbi:hypothetical protein X975_07311, partial [Stegodyphus mimosarum]